MKTKQHRNGHRSSYSLRRTKCLKLALLSRQFQPRIVLMPETKVPVHYLVLAQ